MKVLKENQNKRKSTLVKVRKTVIKIIITLFFGLFVGSLHAQIIKPKPPKIKPKLNTTIHFSLATPFDKIINAINQGKCFEIAMTSLQLNTKNIGHTSFYVETRHGKGFIQKDGNELKAVFLLHIGLKQTQYEGNVQTTIRIAKDKKNARIDIRNSQYYHLFYDAKIVKKENGYYITVEKNRNDVTVSITFAIYKTPCLI